MDSGSYLVELDGIENHGSRCYNFGMKNILVFKIFVKEAFLHLGLGTALKHFELQNFMLYIV